MSQPVESTTASPVTLRPLLPWWLLLAIGVLSIAFGVLVLAWPGVTVLAFAVLLGAWLVGTGVARIVGAFAWRELRSTSDLVFSGLIGVLYVVAGVLCLADMLTGLAVLAALVALKFLLTGIVDLTIGFSGRRRARTWLIVSGVLSVLLGLVFLVLPELSLLTFAVVTGLGAIALGLLEVVTAVRARSAG